MPSDVKLTPQQTAALQQARQILGHLQPQLDAAKKCGIPGCDEMQRQKQQIDDGLSNIIQYFGAPLP